MIALRCSLDSCISSVKSLLELVTNILFVLSGIHHYYVRLWLHKQAGLLAKDFGGYQPLLGKIDYTE